jgi:glycosyltransferase involved in cell wall biosynthesis
VNNYHPLISIIIPIYNGSNYMQCAINSALNQDYDKIEIIVINDGSIDNTENI